MVVKPIQHVVISTWQPAQITEVWLTNLYLNGASVKRIKSPAKCNQILVSHLSYVVESSSPRQFKEHCEIGICNREGVELNRLILGTPDIEKLPTNSSIDVFLRGSHMGLQPSPQVSGYGIVPTAGQLNGDAVKAHPKINLK